MCIISCVVDEIFGDVEFEVVFFVVLVNNMMYFIYDFLVNVVVW